MAALLAGGAGWWQLELLLGRLAAQAAAGVRPELFGLMEVGSGGTAVPGRRWCGRVLLRAGGRGSGGCRPEHPSTLLNGPCRPQIDGMQPAHARALHAAGFGSADLLADAAEGAVADALAAGIAAARKRGAKG